MEAKKFQEVKNAIIKNLSEIKYDGDLSDLGNEIGHAIGAYITNTSIGCDLEDFIQGVEHGISLIDGTHP